MGRCKEDVENCMAGIVGAEGGIKDGGVAGEVKGMALEDMCCGMMKGDIGAMKN